MRLISDFHDYYDTALSHGIDSTLIYNRKTEENEFFIDPQSGSKSFGDETAEILRPAIEILLEMPHEMKCYAYRKRSADDPCATVEPGIVGFCGFLFPYISIPQSFPYNAKPVYSYSMENIVTTCFDEIEKWKSADPTIFQKSLEEKYEPLRSWSNIQFSVDRWNRIVKMCETKIDETFIKLGLPIFHLRLKSRWKTHQFVLVTNPILRELGFQKVKPADVAFQEISMYLGNELVSQKDPNDTISDDTKIHKHGFDKWSFRKQGRKG